MNKQAPTLLERPEWLSPKDLMEVFGIGRTKANQVCHRLDHIYVGTAIRVHRSVVIARLREGRIP